MRPTSTTWTARTASTLAAMTAANPDAVHLGATADPELEDGTPRDAAEGRRFTVMRTICIGDDVQVVHREEHLRTVPLDLVERRGVVRSPVDGVIERDGGIVGTWSAGRSRSSCAIGKTGSARGAGSTGSVWGACIIRPLGSHAIGDIRGTGATRTTRATRTASATGGR